MTNDLHPVSRRGFLKDAGLLVGGAVLGMSSSAASCSGPIAVTTPVAIKFVCPYCTREFGSLDDLILHAAESHPGNNQGVMYACPYCQERFPSITSLQSHVGTEGLIAFRVNGRTYNMPIKSNWTLAYVLREKLGLTGTKIGCELGSCGACTIIVDGRAVHACLVLAIELDGSNVQTVEGLSDGITLSPLQQAFVDGDAVQCGYCTPGFLMSAKHLLDRSPAPTRDEVRSALSSNLCICGHTKKIVDAVLACAGRVK
jgi:aerobic carbon-monoxide dehydrogenase small subunit